MPNDDDLLNGLWPAVEWEALKAAARGIKLQTEFQGKAGKAAERRIRQALERRAR